MLKNYFKMAFRNLARNKVFSFVNITGLSLGLACCMLIVLYTKDEVSFDRFQENQKDLYRVMVTMSDEHGTQTIGSTNAIHGPTFREEIPEIKEVLRTQSSNFIVRKDNELLNQPVLFADANFFSVFTMPLLSGHPETALSDIHSIVLTERLAEKYFNTSEAVGKTLDLKIRDEFQTFTVSAIARNCPENSSVQFEAILPFSFQEAMGWTDTAWLGFYMNTFVLLNKNADYQEVVPKLNRVFASKSATEISQIKDFKQKIYFHLQPFLEIHLNSEPGDLRNGLDHGSSPTYSYVLSGIALFILLIACINFVNLTVARSLNRAREIGIRKVIGSQRRQLVIQFLGESFLFTLIAFVLALVLAQLALPTFNELANKQLSLSYLIDARLVLAYLGLLVFTGLVAGAYPALVLSGFNPVQTLYKRARLTRRNYVTQALVVFQFALSVCLVIGTLVIYSQFEYLTNKDLGYNDENLLSFSLGRGNSNRQALDLIRQELENTAGVQELAAFNGNYNGTMGTLDGGRTMGFGYISVDDHFLPVLQIPVVKGRNFSSEFPSDPTQSIIVNEAFVKEAGWENPIGKEVNFEWKNQKLRVIGVIRDYHFASLKEEIKPLLLTQDPNYGLGRLFVKINPGDVPSTLRKIEEIFRKHVPLMPFEYAFEDVTNAKRYEKEGKWKQVITLSALFSIFVSCIGLFGLATFNAETRVKEVGIRKVLGASVFRIVSLLATDFIKLVLLSIVLALPIAYYAIGLWLEDFPYRIEITWGYFILAAIPAVAVAVLTVSLQSAKAALMNPVKSLRSE
jgi:putative ABC transport system permease protein